MNHFKKIYFLIKAIGNQLKQWFLELPRYKQVVAVVGTIAILILAWRILPAKDVATDITEAPKQVTLASVAELSNKSTPVPLSGQVTSTNEATIRAEGSGRLTRVNKKLGDRVVAGEIIASFENSGERASVLQAQGALESAKAARDIALINSQTTNTTINDTKTNTINAINSAYVAMDDIVRTKTDILFTDPRQQTPRLKLLIPDSLLQTKLENSRAQIEIMLNNRSQVNLGLSQDSDLIAEIQKVQNETQVVKNYLDDINSALVKAIPDQSFSQAGIDGQKAVVSGARQTISGTQSSLSGSKVALQNAIAAQEVAGRTTGDRNPNTASVDAAVKSAQGAYDAALSRLEKTIIRSPINGTLNSLTIETGDYVTPSSQVAVVSNNGSLEVVAYVSGDDSNRINVGSSVKIDSTVRGIVTRKASAIDPVTKKIEVRIGILDENVDLINGQSVRIEISNVQASTIGTMIKVPLSSVKITPRGSYVFSLSATSSLVSVPVVTGTLMGEEVQIQSGLTPDMIIVKDARGLKEGEVVTTASSEINQ